MLVLLTTSVLKRREVPATVSSFYVSVLYTAMLRMSTAAVVLGCFYFCPLDCDASVMVVDCAAVETGYVLEKYVTSPLLLLSFASILLLLLLLKRDMHLCFLVAVLLLLIIFLLAALLLLVVLVLLTTSVLKQREVPANVSSFEVSVLYTCLLYTSPSPRDRG